jgi:hypothetical protein
MSALLRRQSVRIKAVILALMVAASLAWMAAPAAAYPSGCSSGIGYNQVGAFRAYYAWANCTGGSGYYHVDAACYWYGSYMYIEGPTKRVGQGQSRAACPHSSRPVGTGWTEWG